MKKAITHLRLEQVNPGKLQKLDELAPEHQRVVQAYKVKSSKIVGVDIGMASIVSTSEGKRYGQVSAELRRRVERSTEKRRRKQKLNACLKRKNKPVVSLSDHRIEALARNEIGRALNQMLDDMPEGVNVALERLSVKDMRLNSKQMNRALRASQLASARDKLKFKLDERGIRYRSVQPAYSSQQCSHCGFTLSLNRRSQAVFRCLWCGYEANADENAAQNIAERFGDDELNALSFRDVETVLAIRFMRRLPVARSATAGLELQPEVGRSPTLAIWLPKGKVVVAEDWAKPNSQPLPTVNQPGQDPCHHCL